MDTIIDYILWRSNDRLTGASFTDIDNIILSYISYLELSPALPDGKSCTLREAIAVMKKHGFKDASRKVPDYAFIDALSSSERFGTLMLSRYSSHFEEESACQFAAVQIQIERDLFYLSFRGTDNSIAGWKEDFMISFTRTKSQKYAAEYVLSAVSIRNRYYIGGHSKGANLALYASASLPEALLPCILRIYMNDGPGLCPEVMDASRISHLGEKIIKILPEYDVIGKLYEPEAGTVKIVKSAENGVMQHILTSWGVDHGRLLTAEKHSARSLFINDTLDKWVESASLDQRKLFVDSFFDALASDGSHTITDIKSKGPFGFENALITFTGGNKDVLKIAAKLPVTALAGHPVSEKTFSGILSSIGNSKLLQAILLAAAGILCLILPESLLSVAMGLLFLAVLLFEIMVTFRRLKKSRWDFHKERIRVILCIVLAAVYGIILVKSQALFLFSSALFGVLFLVWSFHAFSNPGKGFTFVRHLIEGIFFALDGLYILVAPEKDMVWYMYSLAVVLLLDSAARLFEFFYGRKKQL
jgi:uncharacterized membrane protein YhaH (DUF805 family)